MLIPAHKIGGRKLLDSLMSIFNDRYPMRKIVKQWYQMMNRTLMMKIPEILGGDDDLIVQSEKNLSWAQR